METFKKHLEHKNYVVKTIKKILSQANQYLKWLKINNISAEALTYQDTLNYIGHHQNKNTTKTQINEHLTSIGHYQTYKTYPNPTIKVRLIGREKKINYLFSEKELQKLYETYQTHPNHNSTSNLLLTLIITQSLERHEILKLKKSEINLEKAEIHITSSFKKKNSRILSLSSTQIIPLQNYLKLNPKSDKFITKNQLRTHLKNLIIHLQSQKQEHNLDIKSFNQLRQSRYKQWIKTQGLRQAQYLGGFKNAMSIQKYQENDLEDLTHNINKHHPLQ